MKIPAFDYHRPSSVQETLRLLGDLGDEAKILAGGQSLVPLLALRLSRPSNLVDIGKVPDLDSISEAPSGELSVGCMVRHAAAECSEVVRAAAPLVWRAMPNIGHRAIRNRGTLCGSLAHADPAAELPAVAVATEATLALSGPGGERLVPAGQFFTGYLSCDLAADEMLVEVRFPRAAQRSVWSLQEVTRRHGDFALIGLAAGSEVDPDGRIRQARLVFFGAADVPVRVEDAERLLEGNEPGADLFAEAASVVTAALDPPSDLHGSAAYRRHLGGVLTRRCLADMFAQEVGQQ